MTLEPPLRTGLEGFPTEIWKRIRSASSRLLLLDYDGTLAPFEIERMHARLPERTAQALRRIVERAGDVVAIVSGRPLAELIELAGDLPVYLVGSHGWERRTPAGERIAIAVPPLVAERLALARSAAEEAGWTGRLETKPAAVMLHTRGLPAAEAGRIERECEALWRKSFLREGLELLPADGGLELRAAAFDKGRVVRELRRRHPDAGVVVFIGDDAGDESAFEALRGDGVTVRVGADSRPTRALWRLESPAAVRSLLERWADSAH